MAGDGNEEKEKNSTNSYNVCTAHYNVVVTELRKTDAVALQTRNGKVCIGQ